MGREPFYFGTQASVAAAAAANVKMRFQLDASVLFCLWWYSERGMPTYAFPLFPPCPLIDVQQSKKKSSDMIIIMIIILLPNSFG
jgi:hypothetical protein